MKLNKKGWGTLEMFLLSAGLFIALLVAVYFISKLYGSFDRSIDNKHYANLETKLASAAKRYVLENNVSIDNEITIKYDVLRNMGYINDLVDEYNNNCTGYVLVTKIDFVNNYKAYISCNNYKTENLIQ